MTTEIEVLDSLPGTGKSHAIFDYMKQNQEKPWLYLSPMLTEIHDRVQAEAQRVGMEFYNPLGEDDIKSEEVLELLKLGVNIACTHALTLKFKHEHLEYLRYMKYQIVCDEEMSLIDKYEIPKADMDFLKEQDLIEIDRENFGRVSFSNKKMDYKAAYGRIKMLCDRGCLYAAKNSDAFLVTYVSPDIIFNADRFILCTYNYQGSVMQAFLRLHGIADKEMSDITTYKNTDDVRKSLQDLIEFIETPSVIKIQEGCNLSKGWWSTHSDKAGTKKLKHSDVFKAIAATIRHTKTPVDQMFFTIPKDYLDKVPKSTISHKSFLSCNTKATNAYAHKTLAIHAFDLHPNVNVLSYLQSYGCTVDQEKYALNLLIQWLFRGCIRKGEKMKVAILSKRMNTIFKNWLVAQSDSCDRIET